MTIAWAGAALGALAGLGLLVIAARVAAIRRTQLAVRVLPYIQDLPQVAQSPELRAALDQQTGAAVGVFGPVLRAAAGAVERVMGGAASVRRRLQRANLPLSVYEFRIEQVTWGLAGFGAMAVLGTVRALADPTTAVASLILCLVGFVVGVMARDYHLSSQATRREREILVEFPVIAELLALSVAAGESPVSALDRVVRRSGGELSVDLARVLAAIRTGEPVAHAFDGLAATSGLPLVSRFAQGVAVAVERGTPLADILHAQAADVREASRRALIETAARKEVMMMVPVIFIVMPITVVFAFFPGVIGLSLTTP